MATPAGDIISIKGLQLPHGIKTANIWQQPKELPATVDLILELHDTFNSAASQDALDNSTIHYGELAKKIRACSVQDQTTFDAIHRIKQVAYEMASKDGDHFILAKMQVSLKIPQASMAGEGTIFANRSSFDRHGAWQSETKTYSVQRVKVMKKIGVNASEKTAKQPLVVTCAVDCDGAEDDTGGISQLEQWILTWMEEGSGFFETLEALAVALVRHIIDHLNRGELGGDKVWIKIEKPKAIVWAECPAVEVTRKRIR